MKLQALRILVFLSELVLVTLSFLATYYFANHFHNINPFDFLPRAEVITEPQPFYLYVQAQYVALAVWAVLLWVRSGYRNLRVQTYRMVFQHFLVNGIIFLSVYTSVSFLFKFTFLSRAFILVYTFNCIFLLIINRIVVLWAAQNMRRSGYNIKDVLLVGSGRRAQHFMSLNAKHPEWGYRIIGILDRDAMLVGEEVADYKILGVLEDLPDILDKVVVDEVFFITPRKWLEDVSKCILYCEAIGVPATLSTDLFDLEIASGVQKCLEHSTFLTFETHLLKSGELFLKRLIDIIAASFILLFSAPVLVMVMIAIKVSSSGPIFFRQIRCSRNGRTFKLYKFRSMVTNAERMLSELKTKNEVDGPVFKMTHDPRVTRVGRFLRKTSLDEFPQFWNVLMGDMSIVGPRPPLPNEVDEYEPWQRRRLSMKPGITCIWQVSGRNNIPFEKWMEMDLSYIDNWSLWLDLKILFKTVGAVFASTGK